MTLAAVLALGALLGAAHATAPMARAECEGGLVFSATVGYAEAAVVGRVTDVARHSNGFVDVLGVRVEQAYGIVTGATYSARFTTAWCADNVRVGSRVVLLLGVHIPDAQLDGDYYFVEGQSVTSAEAAAVGAALPDTDTVTEIAQRGAPADASAFLIGAGALGFGLAVRRVRRGGVRPGTPRPRTRAA